jgi:hypothetical protein
MARRSLDRRIKRLERAAAAKKAAKSTPPATQKSTPNPEKHK